MAVELDLRQNLNDGTAPRFDDTDMIASVEPAVFERQQGARVALVVLCVCQREVLEVVPLCIIKPAVLVMKAFSFSTPRSFFQSS